MTPLPAKLKSRFKEGIKKYQKILNNAKSADANEENTRIIVVDILAELLGYDKFREITTEKAIRKTFCDIAIKIEDSILYLVEIKAVGIDLKEDHMRQVMNYAANAGIDWTILTNGHVWKVYKIHFTKPIDAELVFDFDLFTLNQKKQDDFEMLFCLSREAINKSILDDIYKVKQASSRHLIAQVVLTEPILDNIRKALRKISPGAKITTDEVRNILLAEVFKGEVLEGDKAITAKKKVKKEQNSSQASVGRTARETSVESSWTKTELTEYLRNTTPFQKALLGALVQVDKEPAAGKNVVALMNRIAKEKLSKIITKEIQGKDIAGARAGLSMRRKPLHKEDILDCSWNDSEKDNLYAIKGIYKQMIIDWAREEGLA